MKMIYSSIVCTNSSFTALVVSLYYWPAFCFLKHVWPGPPIRIDLVQGFTNYQKVRTSASDCGWPVVLVWVGLN
jgi:hypothetical protein